MSDGTLYACGHIQAERDIEDGEVMLLKVMKAKCTECILFDSHHCLNQIMDGTYECEFCYPEGTD